MLFRRTPDAKKSQRRASNGKVKKRKRIDSDTDDRAFDEVEPRSRSMWKIEAVGIGTVALTLLTGFALFSYSPVKQGSKQLIQNAIGIVGHYFAYSIFWCVGYAGLLLLPLMVVTAFWYIKGKQGIRLLFKALVSLMILLTMSVFFGLHKGIYWKWLPKLPAEFQGGVIGRWGQSLLNDNFGETGSLILLSACLFIFLHLLTGISIVELASVTGRLVRQVAHWFVSCIKSIKHKVLQWYFNRLDKHTEEVYVPPPRKAEEAPKVKPRKTKILTKPSESIEIVERKTEQRGEYILPGFDLLKDPPPQSGLVDQEELNENAAILESKLSDFNIEGKVRDIRTGPVVSCYEVMPAPGVKISKIVNLADDIALALKSKVPPRVAPVPGKSVLGVEIPNKNREIVYFKEIIGSKNFLNYPGSLRIALGKDTFGEPMVTALEEMPHLLIAGATGSGKSVCINTVMLSFLLTCTPEDLNLILVDPKMLELSDYNKIPHLRTDVITDVHLAPTALAWAVQEMENRFHLLADQGVRNIKEFNKLVEEQGKNPTPASDNGQGESVLLKRLPYLVIIIDELADLMMMAAREIEEHIARLAQMGRAAGIHLILATQRPSVDVITGLIKANMPCRIAFQVSSKVDSRVVIDQNGAEKLLGKGDMLFLPPGTGRLKRIHGAYVDEKEIKKIVDFWGEQQRSIERIDDIFEKLAPLTDAEIEDGEKDELFDEAVRIVVSTGIASISLLQRRLRVGHARAARLIDIMERSGIVGPFTGSKAREVLLTLEDLQNKGK